MRLSGAAGSHCSSLSAISISAALDARKVSGKPPAPHALGGATRSRGAATGSPGRLPTREQQSGASASDSSDTASSSASGPASVASPGASALAAGQAPRAPEAAGPARRARLRRGRGRRPRSPGHAEPGAARGAATRTRFRGPWPSARRDAALRPRERPPPAALSGVLKAPPLGARAGLPRAEPRREAAGWGAARGPLCGRLVFSFLLEEQRKGAPGPAAPDQVDPRNRGAFSSGDASATETMASAACPPCARRPLAARCALLSAGNKPERPAVCEGRGGELRGGGGAARGRRSERPAAAGARSPSPTPSSDVEDAQRQSLARLRPSPRPRWRPRLLALHEEQGEARGRGAYSWGSPWCQCCKDWTEGRGLEEEIGWTTCINPATPAMWPGAGQVTSWAS